MASPNVLLVDDEVDFAESIADVLRLHGNTVSVAHSGEAALEIVERQTFDLVLLDVRMPGMDGLECLGRMRALRPGIQVVMVTAFTKNELIRQAMAEGAVNVLHKPLKMRELLATIQFLTKRASILIVDDDMDLATGMRELLAEAGYAVRVATSCRSAKEAIKAEKVDILLLDFRLPDGNPIDLVGLAKASNPNVFAMIITGYPEEVTSKLPCVSADDILVKPFRPADLVQVLRERSSRVEKSK